MSDKIIIGFSKPKKWKLFAWIIQTAYNTPYDHVYIQFYSEKFDRHLVYQASNLAVNFIEYSNFCSINDVVKEFEFDMDAINRVEMIQWAIDNCGKPYGIKSALGLGIVRLFDIFGKKIKNPFSDDDKTYVCCELAAYVLKEFEHFQIEEDLNLINPKELYELLSLHG